MDLRREYRHVLLVPFDEEYGYRIEFTYNPEVEWVESVTPYNEQYCQVIIGGIVAEEVGEDA